MEKISAEKYLLALKELGKTPNGQLVLEFLEELYVKPAAFTADPYITAYQLGQKELIQGIILNSNQETTNASILGEW
jgi:hypothetical protein